MPIHLSFSSFFFNDTATTEIYTLSLHDALPISDPTTLTIAMNGSPSDLDPHSVYDYRSAMPLRGPYEGLIALEGSATDKYVPVLSESWEANDDKSVWTFTIRSGVTFHDGTPVDAEAVRASFERFLTMGLGPA